VILQTHAVTLFSIPARTPKRLHQLIVFEEVERFFKRLEVVGTQEDKRRSPIACDQDAIVLPFDPVG
jgi:hypothetical protein